MHYFENEKNQKFFADPKNVPFTTSPGEEGTPPPQTFPLGASILGPSALDPLLLF